MNRKILVSFRESFAGPDLVASVQWGIEVEVAHFVRDRKDGPASSHCFFTDLADHWPAPPQDFYSYWVDGNSVSLRYLTRLFKQEQKQIGNP